MIRFFKRLFICITVLALPHTNGYAQLAEIKPFDTAQNIHAATDRIFADAVKENTLGNSKEAQALFMRFAEARPEVAATYYELARINARDNNPVLAAQNIRKAMKLDTTNKWYQEFYGNMLANGNQFLEAADVFARLADRYKPNDDYLLKSSLLYQRANSYDKAIGELKRLMALRGPEEELLLQMNQIYLKQNKIEEAAKNLRLLIDANPKEGRYYALLAELYYNNLKVEKAKEVLDEAEKKFPDDIAVQLGIASYYRKKNDTARYFEYVSKTIVNKTIDEQTQITLLVSYLQDMGKDTLAHANALLLTEKLVQAKGNNASLLSIYGDLLSMNNRQNEAIEAYKKSIRIDSANVSVWQQLLFSLTDKASADSLIFYSGNALQLYPSSAIIYYLNGIGYVNKKEFAKGIESIATAIDFQPKDNKGLLAEMYGSLGDAYNSNREYTKADKNFEEALSFAPDNATILNNYAYYLSVRKERLADAEKFSARSLQIRPGEATFLDTYGWIFYQQGKYERAKELIQQAIDKNGNDADATLYEHLGDVYFKLNNLDKALQNWKLAKQKDPVNEQLDLKIKNKKLYE
jgi:tetratricopeptide (TPR) repeat protein